MKIALAFLLVLVSIASYLYLALVHGIYQKVPVAHLAGAGIGVALLARLAWSKRSRTAAALAVLSALIAGLFALDTFYFSMYAERAPRLRPGDEVAAEDLALRDASGAPFDFEEEIRRAPATILVFYRGFW